MADDLIKIGIMATIEWKNAEGELIETAEEFRSLPALYDHVARKLLKEPDRKDEQVEIYLTIPPEEAPPTEVDAAAKDLSEPPEEPKEHRLVISTGTFEEVATDLAGRVMTPAQAMVQLQMVVSQVAELADLKGIILTTVFGDGQAAGFGFVSESTDVQETDIKVLGSSAANQADLFKDSMRKKRNIEFPGDSNIITPDMLRKGG